MTLVAGIGHWATGEIDWQLGGKEAYEARLRSESVISVSLDLSMAWTSTAISADPHGCRSSR